MPEGSRGRGKDRLAARIGRVRHAGPASGTGRRGGCGNDHRRSRGNHHHPVSVPLLLNPLHYRIRTGQALAVAIVFCWEWWFNPPHATINTVLAVLSLIVQLGVCVFPVPCCLGIIAVFIGFCLVGDSSGPSQLLAVALACGTMAYDMKLTWVMAASVPLLGALIYQSTFRPLHELHPAHNDVPVLVFLLYLVVFFGYTSRQRAEIIDARVEAEQAEELRRRVEVARLVHDSVTGDLSNIARVAQRQVRLTSDPEEAEAWRGINDRTIRVLDSVHAVIRQLSDDPGRSAAAGGGVDGRSESFVPALRAHVDQNVRRLREAGFEGDVRIINHAHYQHRDDPSDVAQRSACALGVVDEVFTNIMRHGMPGVGVYQVTITCEDRQVEVVSINRIVVSPDDDGRCDLPGGTGIKFHREEVERLGGVLSADAEDDEWIVYARIPRRQPAE